MKDSIEIDLDPTGRQPKIKVKNDHPESSKKQKAIREEEVAQFIKELESQIQKIEGTREEWVRRENRWYKQRYGIRPKKTFPWPGCSNSMVMTIDKSIRKLRPGYVRLFWTDGLLCEFKAPRNEQLSEQLKDAQEYNAHLLDHLIREKMTDSFKKVVLTADRMLNSGFGLIKVSYEYRTEVKEYTIDLDELHKEKQVFIHSNQDIGLPENEKSLIEFFLLELEEQGCHLDLEEKDEFKELEKAIKAFRKGKNKFVFKIEKVVAHAPLWTVCNPRDIIVHGSFSGVQDAFMICHNIKVLPNDLRKLARSGKLDAEVVEEILNKHKAKSRSHSQIEEGEQNIANLTGSNHFEEEDRILLREVSCYASPDSSKILTRCIITYCPDYLEKPGKFVKLPFDDSKWSYVKVPLDFTDNGWLHHRGIPAMLDYYSTLINVKHNQLIDNTTLTTAPMLEYVAGSVNISHLRYIPGQGVPVKAANSIRQIQIHPGNVQGLQDQIAFLKHEIEDYIATPDFTLSDPNQPGTKARTATEILSKAQDREGIFGLDADIFLDSMQELLQMTWSRWLQYGSEEYELSVTGQENPVKWLRSQGYGNARIIATGSAQESNPVLKSRQVEMFMQMAHSDVFKPMMEIHNIAQEIAKMVATRRHNEFIKDPKVYAQEMQQMMQQAEQKEKEAAMLQLMAQKAQMDHEKELEKIKGENDKTLEEIKGENNLDEVFAKGKLEKGKDAKKDKGHKPALRAV